jgi:hypothetical protein
VAQFSNLTSVSLENKIGQTFLLAMSMMPLFGVMRITTSLKLIFRMQ